jgi:hypothetical protein
MSSESQNSQEKPDLTKYIGLGFLAGLVVCVLVLEYYGYIRHPAKEDALVIEEFRLLTLNTDEDLKVSQKSSGREGFCVNGYLLVRPQNGKNVAGILVDKKNRPIACQNDLQPVPSHNE